MADIATNVTRAAIDLGVGFWGPITATLDWCEVRGPALPLVRMCLDPKGLL
jgi:hypothetical protein